MGFACVSSDSIYEETLIATRSHYLPSDPMGVSWLSFRKSCDTILQYSVIHHMILSLTNNVGYSTTNLYVKLFAHISTRHYLVFSAPN